MDPKLHLVSAPWSKADNTSIQLGVLHSYVDKVFAGVVDVVSYSAFVGIPFRVAGGDLFPFFEAASRAGEHSFMALYLRRYRDLVPPVDALRDAVASTRSGDVELSEESLDRLEAATIDYIEEEIAPNLDPERVNLVGFSLNYDQVYASAFMARLLVERYGQLELAFLFGGYSTSVPYVVDLLCRLEVPGCLVIGEGERKLELILRALLADESDHDGHSLDARIAAAAPGVYEIRANAQAFEPRDEDYATQFADLSTLPVPDYHEYFETLAALTDSDETYQLLCSRVHIMVEGSRGCFAKCDFCGLNATWRGFRKSTAQAVAAQVDELASRHASTRIDFVDNVCDTWAEAFADRTREAGLRYQTLYELRAHHKEAFWTKLALAGAVEVQLGIEALSQPLLTHIGKGTRVVQNVAAQKFLTELGVWSYGNLITDHPRSTPADAAENRRVLQACCHLGQFGLARYGVAPGSPLYRTLSVEDRQTLRPRLSPTYPEAFVPFAIENFCDAPPALTCDPATSQAWAEFRTWFAGFSEGVERCQPQLHVTRLGPDKRLVVDARAERVRHHLLQGDERVVYDACHAGPKRRHLSRMTGLTESRVATAVSSLLEREIAIDIEDCVISLATRPRDELIHNLYRDAEERLPQRRPTTMPLVELGRSGCALPR